MRHVRHRMAAGPLPRRLPFGHGGREWSAVVEVRAVTTVFRPTPTAKP